MSHQSGVLTAFPQRFKKMQIAEVRAVQTLCRVRPTIGRSVRPTDRRTDATKRIYYSPNNKKVFRRYEVDTKYYGRKDGRAL